MPSHRGLRLAYRAVYIQLDHVGFRSADRGGYTARVDTAVSSRSAFALGFRLGVDIQPRHMWCRVADRSYRRGADHSCARYAFALLVAVNIPRC